MIVALDKPLKAKNKKLHNPHSRTVADVILLNRCFTYDTYFCFRTEVEVSTAF